MNERHHERGGRRGRPPYTRDDAPRGRRGRPPWAGDEGRRRGRMRRGDVRTALLIALLDGPAHGYELIQALEEKTGGRWRPSPGSVYPTLQQLADEGMVTASDEEGKRTFALTDAGRAEAESRVADQGLPWESMERGNGRRGGLRAAVRDLHMAATQVGVTGSPEAVERATEILTQARKDIYRLLADA